VAALRSGAWLLCGILGGTAALVMTVARVPLSRLMLGGPEHGDAVVITAVSLLLLLGGSIQSGILNTHQRVSALALSSILSSVVGTCLSLLIIWRWRTAGVPWAILATCFVPWAVSAYYVHRLQPPSDLRPNRKEAFAAAAGLLRFGAPFTASLLVGAGVLTTLPVIVLHALGAEAAGYYRAASAVAVSYLGFVTASLSQDYYPRVSAVADKKDVLCRLINEQHRLVLLLGGPIILGMLALAPYIVPLIYSRQFSPSVDLLEWQLLGDIFRLAAWTMAFVILGRSGGVIFFGLEAGAGASLLLFSWLGMRWYGLEGLGMGFVGCSIFYYLLNWAIVRRTIGLRWTTQNASLLMTLIACGLVIRLLPELGMERLRTPVALALAALMSGYSLLVLWREAGGSTELLALLRRRGRQDPATKAVQE
jgi:antigen flippase